MLGRDKPDVQPLRPQTARDVSEQYRARVPGAVSRLNDGMQIQLALLYAMYDVADELRKLRADLAVRDGRGMPPDLAPPAGSQS